MAHDPLYPGQPATERQHAYATGGAIEEARLAGLLIRRNDWRDIFLAITDIMATDDTQSAVTDITGVFVGPVRDGERWAITLGKVRFDVLYNPERAQIYRVPPPAGPASAKPPPRVLQDAA